MYRNQLLLRYNIIEMAKSLCPQKNCCIMNMVSFEKSIIKLKRQRASSAKENFWKDNKLNKDIYLFSLSHIPFQPCNNEKCNKTIYATLA